MTAAVTEPRLGLLQDLVDAGRERHAGGDDERHYWTGFILGFTAAFADDEVLTDLLAEARLHMWAATYSLRSATARLELLGSNFVATDRAKYLRACGLLYGWKQGTSERDDAEECSLCETRILTDTDEHTHCTFHGYLCSESCLRSTCERGCYSVGALSGTL